MLKIDIPTANVSAKVFEQHTLPTPPNGTETEINGELILLFEDEEEAVAYLDKLEDYASELDDNSAERATINALVTAINNDEFVQAYLQ
ncbi:MULTISPECIES: hypothetical protein [Mucilaginibacter]|uniref:hypothetical protein n=1 Tax=Mucilaginibacter TaxID=423349 RepID=UPI0020918428|nr:MULTISPECIES: hypothetical protein [Mucilaginibacter]MCO5934856.1 hypothetical protein [Mucilaginibacter aurantiaciroseus]MEB0262497.1 hypothetical protein [Mucilaginibacter sp. 10I4]MEB0279937.1 hypothetical protein [Mucilaginibacter sp. 10B2]MEB0300083.1 hypothetical protein [Mucilaginibacter sp. 5C4]WPX21895.1 hypothetical protein RHM67_11425 [Mucilaginibacter sp. 5C4]